MRHSEPTPTGQAACPKALPRIIREMWDVVAGFAGAEDRTVRIAGMKFPRDGWSKHG